MVQQPVVFHRIYMYTVSSHDANNDTITYTFNWDDGSIDSSELIPTGIQCIKNHSWTKAGKYTIHVTASDRTTSSSSEMTIWIDAIPVDDVGYFLDDDSDGIFDVFHNNMTGLETVMEMRNGVYLIDMNGDQRWDYEYNTTSGTLMSILQQQPVSDETPFSSLLVCGLIIVVFLLLLMIVYRRRFNKKQ